MCTVIVRVPEHADEPTRLLAVRDEDPRRPWQPLGAWWPDAYPGVVGVRDVRAGGAWLAAHSDSGRIAVLLNRWSAPLPEGVAPVSRGRLALESAAGRGPADVAASQGFNLVEAGRDGARVTMWDGESLRRADIPPGTHLIAHDDLDDPRTARIRFWAGAFADASTEGDGDWWRPWVDLLARSGELAPDDDRAIIRDNRPFGYPTQSLLLCAASLGRDGVDVSYAALDHPGHWNTPMLTGPVLP